MGSRLDWLRALIRAGVGDELADRLSRASKVQADVFDAFAGRPAGSFPVRSSSGHLWHEYFETAGERLKVLASGKLGSDGTVAGPAAGYIDTDLGEGNTLGRAGARWDFSAAGTTNTAAMCILGWANPFNAGPDPVPNSPCHFVITPAAAAFDVWQNDVITNVMTHTFKTPLVCDDGATAAGIHEAEVIIEGQTAQLRLPDGAVRLVSHALIASMSGRYAGFEIFYGTQSTDHRPQIHKVWADPTPGDPSNTGNTAAMYRAIQSFGDFDPVAVTQVSNPAANVAVPNAVADIDAANLKITFRAPASGSVLVELTGYLTMTGATTVFWALSGGVGSLSTAVVGQQFTGQVTFRRIMTGLTPNALVTLVWRHFALAAATATFNRDGPNGFVPTMKVTPLRS